MKAFLSYIRLVRPVNLLIIVFTLYVVRFLFIFPITGFNYSSLPVNDVIYALFSLSFVCAAAAGYIINDYYDVKIDRINRPDKAIIGKTISSPRALKMYGAFNALAILLGFWSCYKAGAYLYGFLFVFYVGALWLYSYRFKATFLLGNILVSVCLALVPLVGIYIQSNGLVFEDDSMNMMHNYAWGISFFAFLTSLIREIVKDMEDVEGDSVAGCKTMPIVIGQNRAKVAVQMLVVFMIILIGAYQIILYSENAMPLLIYCAVFIQLPCLVVAWKVHKASSTKDYKRISGWLKIIMVTGISYFFVLAFEIWIIVALFKSFSK